MIDFIAIFIMAVAAQALAIALLMLRRNEAVYSVRRSMIEWTYHVCGDWGDASRELLDLPENDYDTLMMSFRSPAKLVAGKHADAWRAWHFSGKKANT